MTKKDLFRIIIKLFGLYTSIGLVFFIIPQNFISFFQIPFNGASILPVLLLLFVGLVMFILLFKPDWIIRLFKLDKGFDDPEIDLSTGKAESIIRLGLILISLFLIIDSIPDFITELFYVFKSSINNNKTSLNDLLHVFSENTPNYFLLFKYGINIILGFLILTNFKGLSKRIERVNNKNDKAQTS